MGDTDGASDRFSTDTIVSFAAWRLLCCYPV
jgi:hypothetical protein